MEQTFGDNDKTPPHITQTNSLNSSQNLISKNYSAGFKNLNGSSYPQKTRSNPDEAIHTQHQDILLNSKSFNLAMLGVPVMEKRARADIGLPVFHMDPHETEISLNVTNNSILDAVQTLP